MAIVKDGDVVTELLSVELTETEVLEYSKELAKHTQDLDTLEVRKKDLVAELNAGIAKIKAELNILSRKIVTGEEERDVECQWDFDWEGGVRVLVRQDNAEEVRSLPISDFERQAAVPTEDEEEGEPANEDFAEEGEDDEQPVEGEAEAEATPDEATTETEATESA